MTPTFRSVIEGVFGAISAFSPTVVEVVAVGEQLKLILDDLSPDEHVVLVSTLQGHSTEDISRSMGKSERTVRRLFAQARRRFEQRLLESGARTKESAVTRPTQIPEPQAPLKFSDFVLEQLIGSGGMGRVQCQYCPTCARIFATSWGHTAAKRWTVHSKSNWRGL